MDKEESVSLGVEDTRVIQRWHLTIYNITQQDYDEFISYTKEHAKNKGSIALKQLLALSKPKVEPKVERSSPKTIGKRSDSNE